MGSEPITRDGRVNTYLVIAAKCMELAQVTDDNKRKLSLLDMARAWLTVAEQSEKNRQTTLVYETQPTKE
jgi:hypothetical protein